LRSLLNKFITNGYNRLRPILGERHALTINRRQRLGEARETLVPFEGKKERKQGGKERRGKTRRGRGGLARYATVIFAGKTIARAIRYLVYLVIAKAIGLHGLGYYAVGLHCVRLFSGNTTDTEKRGVVKSATEAQEKDGDHKIDKSDPALLSSLIGSLFSGGLLFAFADVVADRIFRKPGLAVVFRYLAVSIPFTAVTSVALSSLRGFRRKRYRMVIKDLLQPAVILLGVTVLAMAGLRIHALMLSYVAATVLGASIAAYSASWSFSFLSTALTKNWRELSDSRPIAARLRSVPTALFSMGHQLLNRFLQRPQILILGLFARPLDVGLFAVVYGIMIPFFELRRGFDKYFRRHVGYLYRRGQEEELRRQVQLYSKWLFALAVPIALFGIAFTKPILGLFGPQFTKAAPLLQIALVAFFVW